MTRAKAVKVKVIRSFLISLASAVLFKVKQLKIAYKLN